MISCSQSGHSRVEGAGRVGLGVEPALEAGLAGGAAEGQLAGDQLVQDHAEREDVAARVVAHPEHLLGGDVGVRAHRLRDDLGHQVGELVVPRESEVDEHRLAALAKQDVGRRDVQVDDVLAMQVVQRRGHAGADAGDLLRRERPAAQPGGERRRRGRAP